MDKIEKLTAAGFPVAVKQGVVLVDFFAQWHGPCHKQGDLLNALVDEERFPEEVKVTKLDVDEAPVIAAKFEVDIIPTLVIFRDGHEIGRIVGEADENQVMKLFPGTAE
ncbi:MAG: thioredoxin family protein [Lentisphaerae bacterium]|nr:thioredoxin family protein [Lentisphaerota bacterium]